MGAEFGQGTGEIWLDYVDCTGLESSLDLCSHSGWGDHHCNHYEDVEAVCEGELCQETKNIHTYAHTHTLTYNNLFAQPESKKYMYPAIPYSNLKFSDSRVPVVKAEDNGLNSSSTHRFVCICYHLATKTPTKMNICSIHCIHMVPLM